MKTPGSPSKRDYKLLYDESKRSLKHIMYSHDKKIKTAIMDYDILSGKLIDLEKEHKQQKDSYEEKLKILAHKYAAAQSKTSTDLDHTKEESYKQLKEKDSIIQSQREANEQLITENKALKLKYEQAQKENGEMQSATLAPKLCRKPSEEVIRQKSRGRGKKNTTLEIKCEAENLRK